MKEQTGFGNKLLNRYFIFLWLINLLVNVAHCGLNSLISVYVGYLGLGSQFNGYIGIVFALFAIASRFLCGSLSDRVGRRYILALSTLLFAVGTLFFGFFGYSLIFLLLMRGFQSFGYGTNSQTVGAATADVMPPSKVGFGIAAVWVTMSVSQIASSTLVSRSIANESYSQLFIIFAVLLAIATVLGFLCNYEKKSWFKRAEPEPEETQKGLKRYLEPKAIPAGIMLVFTCVSFVGVTHFFYSFAGSIGYEHPELFFYVSAVVMFFSSVVLSKYADKLNPLLLVAPGLIGGAICFMLLAFSTTGSNATIIIASIFYGISMGTINPIFNQIAVKASPASRRGAANATFFFAMDIGYAIGTVFWGWAVEAFSYRFSYVTAAVLMIVSLITCWLLLRRQNTAKAN